MIKGMQYHPEKTDIWNAGITLYTMLTGKLPFIDKNIKSLYPKIIEGNVVYPDNLSKQAVDILKGLLNIDPSARLDFRRIFAHAWMQSHIPHGYPIHIHAGKVANA